MGAYVKRPNASPQSIPNNTVTAISFTTEVFDTAGMFDAGSPTRLTVQQPGLYLISGSGSFVANAVGDRQAQARLNGATTLIIQTGPTAATLFWSGTFAIVDEFVAGDFVELAVKQLSGGNLDSADCFLSALAFGVV